jgi:hypothetical protein
MARCMHALSRRRTASSRRESLLGGGMTPAGSWQRSRARTGRPCKMSAIVRRAKSESRSSRRVTRLECARPGRDWPPSPQPAASPRRLPPIAYVHMSARRPLICRGATSCSRWPPRAPSRPPRRRRAHARAGRLVRAMRPVDIVAVALATGARFASAAVSQEQIEAVFGTTTGLFSGCATIASPVEAHTLTRADQRGQTLGSQGGARRRRQQLALPAVRAARQGHPLGRLERRRLRTVECVPPSPVLATAALTPHCAVVRTASVITGTAHRSQAHTARCR